MYVALFILLLFALLGMLFGHFRRKKIICRIQCMDKCRKCSLLEELAEPFGYVYHCCCGFFSSTIDAWQKAAGYTWLYDYMAPRFQMVFDSLPVYFNYRGRTWLIEFWKGQYGINTGAEIGIYHADRLLSETEYRTAHFEAAGEEEMLSCSMQLCTEKGACVKISERHWWLTAFLPGYFSYPADLCMHISVTLHSHEMAEAFAQGLIRAGYCPDEICLCGRTVSFVFAGSVKVCGFFRKLKNCIAQFFNRFWCKIFRFVTRPFCRIGDRILYLYYFLPAAFRKMLRIKKDRKTRVKKGASV